MQTKLTDMLMVYEKYTENINDKYIDENDNLSILADRLDLVKDIDDADIYIDEFVGLYSPRV